MATVAILYPPTPSNQGDPSTEIVARIAGAAVTAGQVVYDDPTTGKVLVADAAVAGKHTPAGIVVQQDRAIGQGVNLMRKGHVAGFDIQALNAGAILYLDTAGTINTVANATTTVPLGTVVPTGKVDSTGAVQKVLDLFINPSLNF